MILDRHPDGTAECLGPAGSLGVQQRGRLGPFDSFGHARRFRQRLGPQQPDRGHHRLGRRPRHRPGAGHDDARLKRGVGVVDPVIDAAPPQRLVQVAGAVRGEDNDRGLRRAHGAGFGDRDGEVRQKFEQKRLEFMVGAVDLVDQKERVLRVAERLQQRALQKEILGVEVHVVLARLPDRQHLPGIVPFVQRRARVDALEALQADHLPPQHAAQGFRRLGLAHARRAFQQQGFAQSQREIGRRGQRVICQVLRVDQRALQRGRVLHAGDDRADNHQARPFGRAPPFARMPRRTFSGVIGRRSQRTPTAL